MAKDLESPARTEIGRYTYSFAVSYEFDLRPVLTLRGKTSAGSVHNAAARSLKKAHRALRPINWRSVVVVLEKLPSVPPVPH